MEIREAEEESPEARAERIPRFLERVAKHSVHHGTAQQLLNNCSTPYSEDLQPNQRIEDITLIVNP